LDLFLPPDLVNLSLGSSQGVTREHFEPGQDVFREGELGDRLYIVLQGEAEVRRRDGVGESVVAKLGPGQRFGEMALLNMTTGDATGRCVKGLDVLGLPRQEFAVLGASLPDLKKSFDRLAQERASAPRELASA